MNEVIPNPIPHLDRQHLWDAINEFMCGLSNGENNQNSGRQLEHKCQVVNMLFHPVMWAEDAKNVNHIKDTVELLVAKDSLIGYTFFLSSNPQFTNNWSYLINKIQGYSNALIQFEHFIDEVIEVLNYLFTNVKCRIADLRFKINRFLIIGLDNSSSFQVEMDLDELHKVFPTCRKVDIALTVYLGNTILGCYRCNHNYSIEQIARDIEGIVVKGKHI